MSASPSRSPVGKGPCRPDPQRQRARYASEGVLSATAMLIAHQAAGEGDTPPGKPIGAASRPRTAASRRHDRRRLGQGRGRQIHYIHQSGACHRRHRPAGRHSRRRYLRPASAADRQNKKPQSDGKKIYPIDAWGLQTMSIGYLVAEDAPTIWRGPMVMSAIEQMLRDVAWDNLDVLIIDMPPGTGDAQLTLSQRAALSGAVIVSTPQDLALIDARKGLNMFRKVNVPVLGIIENMSHFLCTDCGADTTFGHGGAAEAARIGPRSWKCRSKWRSAPHRTPERLSSPRIRAGRTPRTTPPSPAPSWPSWTAP